MRFALALLILLSASVASAQSTTGYFIRPSCPTIPTPAANAVICFNVATVTLEYWNGTTYIPLATGSGTANDELVAVFFWLAGWQ